MPVAVSLQLVHCAVKIPGYRGRFCLIFVARITCHRIKHASRIVALVNGLRESRVGDVAPTVRSCIKLGRAVRLRKASVTAGDQAFRQICQDVLVSGSIRDGIGPVELLRQTVDRLVIEFCPDEPYGGADVARIALKRRNPGARSEEQQAAGERGVA